MVCGHPLQSLLLAIDESTDGKQSFQITPSCSVVHQLPGDNLGGDRTIGPSPFAPMVLRRTHRSPMAPTRPLARAILIPLRGTRLTGMRPGMKRRGPSGRRSLLLLKVDAAVASLCDHRRGAQVRELAYHIFPLWSSGLAYKTQEYPLNRHFLSSPLSLNHPRVSGDPACF